MFEYWFIGLTDPQDPEDRRGTFSHHGTTHDFLEVVSQIAQLLDPEIAGDFVRALVEQNKDKLAFLRVVDWKIEFSTSQGQIIKLHKLV